MTPNLDAAIRNAFLAMADGLLRIETATRVEESAGTRLFFTGFHQDGTPFAVETKPFTDVSPVERAAQLARDILSTHTGVTYMGAPVAIRGLAATLREQLKGATDRAAALAETAKSEVADLHNIIGQGEALIEDVKAAKAEVQAALGLSTNGGPSGPLAG